MVAVSLESGFENIVVDVILNNLIRNSIIIRIWRSANDFQELTDIKMIFNGLMNEITSDSAGGILYVMRLILHADDSIIKGFF